MNTPLFVLLALLAAAVAALGASLYALRRENRRLETDSRTLRTALDEARGEVQRQTGACASAEARIAALREQYEAGRLREQQLRKEQEQMLKVQFENLAGRIMTRQSQEFKEQNREAMELLLKPFRDNMAGFHKRIEEIYTYENEQRGALKSQLDRLMQLNASMSEEARNLTQALKGNSKTQGDWGETILNTILESTLTRGQNYEIQRTTTAIDDEGNRKLYRPDAVVYLPERKVIVIDSKVSLTAYVNYTAADDEASRRRMLDAHVASVRQHVRELGAKSYHENVRRYLDRINREGDERHWVSPDFVIMFVPNEPAFLEALKADRDLWVEAYNNKVMIASPTNLFAVLKVVDNMWRSYDMDEKSKEIARCASELYERTRRFVQSFDRVGDALGRAQREYDDAWERLCKQKGQKSIVRAGEELRRLAAHDAERFPQRALDGADEPPVQRTPGAEPLPGLGAEPEAPEDSSGEE